MHRSEQTARVATSTSTPRRRERACGRSRRRRTPRRRDAAGEPRGLLGDAPRSAGRAASRVTMSAVACGHRTSRAVQGQHERGGLSGPVWAQPTTSRPSMMDGIAFGLDGSGRVIAHRAHRLEQAWVETQICRTCKLKLLSVRRCGSTACRRSSIRRATEGCEDNRSLGWAPSGLARHAKGALYVPERHKGKSPWTREWAPTAPGGSAATPRGGPE